MLNTQVASFGKSGRDGIQEVPMPNDSGEEPEGRVELFPVKPANYGKINSLPTPTP